MVCLRGAVVGGYVSKDAGFLALLGETAKRKVYLRECITKRYSIIYLKKDVRATVYNVFK